MIERPKTLLDVNGITGIGVFECPYNDTICTGREVTKAIKSVDDCVNGENSGVEIS